MHRLGSDLGARRTPTMPAPSARCIRRQRTPLDEPYHLLPSRGEPADLGASPRIPAVKLADIGDLLTITPALRALRVRYPHAHVTLLAPAPSLAVLRGSDLPIPTISFDKFRFDEPRQSLRPANLAYAVGLARRLHALRPDAVLLFHHLTTGFGRLKFRALLAAAGAPVRVGLEREPTRLFTHAVTDMGFGAVHEVGYWRALAMRLGADAEPRLLEIALSPEHHAAADSLLREQALTGRQPIVALHPGGGGFSVARRWSAARFSTLGDALVRELGAAVIIVGGPDDRWIWRARLPPA